jgi:hypothetical protein
MSPLEGKEPDDAPAFGTEAGDSVEIASEAPSEVPLDMIERSPVDMFGDWLRFEIDPFTTTNTF